MKRVVLALTALAAAMLAPAAHADPIVTNPFGSLSMSVTPPGTPPATGTARLTINTGSGAAFSQGSTIWFGLRLMGSEDVQMKSFRFLPPATNPDKTCIISDFAGTNTPGYQGSPLFAQDTPAGSPNAHMRMIGGFVRKACGNIQIDVTYSARPLVIYYAAFFGHTAAPWSGKYGEAPWSTVPTGGNKQYENWWNIWGTFDTLGYSNACTSLDGASASCG